MTKPFLLFGFLLIAAMGDFAFGDDTPVFTIVTSETAGTFQDGGRFKVLTWLVRNISKETLFVPESYNPNSPHELQRSAQFRPAAAPTLNIPGIDSRYRYKSAGKWSQWISVRSLRDPGYRWAPIEPRQEVPFPLWDIHDGTLYRTEAVEIRLPYRQNGIQFLATLVWKG